MRGWIVLLLVLAMVGAALPVQGACTCRITDTRQVTGDTVAFKISSNERLHGLAGATITLTGTFDQARTDAATAVSIVAPLASATTLTYGQAGTQRTERVRLATDAPIGQELQLDGPPSTVSSVQQTYDLNPVALSQGTWRWIVTVPEASTLTVELDLRFDRPFTYARGPVGNSGLLEAPVDQDALAQVTHQEDTVSLAAQAQATAPPGQNGFGLIFGSPDAEALGTYGIDGPGNADHRVLALNEAPPIASVTNGPAGEYQLSADATLVRDGSVTGPIMVFYAVSTSF